MNTAPIKKNLLNHSLSFITSIIIAHTLISYKKLSEKYLPKNSPYAAVKRTLLLEYNHFKGTNFYAALLYSHPFCPTPRQISQSTPYFCRHHHNRLNIILMRKNLCTLPPKRQHSCLHAYSLELCAVKVLRGPHQLLLHNPLCHPYLP